MLAKIGDDFILNFSRLELSGDECFEFCVRHKEYRILRSFEGRIEIKLNQGGRTANRRAKLTAEDVRVDGQRL